jgi:hypothetical protein
MMKKSFFIIIWFTLIFSQTFERWYGHDGDDKGYFAIDPTGEGKYFIVAGATNSFTSGQITPKPYLLKIDSLGNLLKEETLPFFGEAYCVNKCQDGGYILTGKYIENFDLFLCKVDTNFRLQWLRTYGYQYEDWGEYVCPTADGGYLVTGSTRSYSGNYIYDIYVIKTDSLGNRQWERIFGHPQPSYDDHGKYCCETNDNNFLIIGNYGGSAVSDFYAIFIKLDNNGNPVWQRVSNSPQLTKSGTKTADNCFVSVGGRAAGYFNIIKVDNNGNILFENNIFYTSGAHAIIEEDNRFVITGSNSNLDLFILKTNEGGSQISWVREYGPTNFDFHQGNSITKTKSGYLVCGYSWNYNGPAPDTGDVYLIRSDTFGLVFLKEKSKIKVNRQEKETIYNIFGQKVESKKVKKGVYYLREKAIFKKVIIF